MNDNPSCQHHRIDNATWQCVECGERMLSQQQDAETVLSAPNAAACTNPDCSGDITDPNCHNPSGLYVPDRSRQQEVVIGWDFTYECERCSNNGSIFDSRGVTWDCGHVHRGERVPARTT